jgi:hypothetical protein
MASVLALPGYANLLSTKDGEVVLTFDGWGYAPHEIVPVALVTITDGLTAPCAAAVYVAHFMTQQFGDDRTEWPRLAREFTSEAAPPMPPDRERGAAP